jgi:pyrroline-5-carboxylate reductase
VSARLVIVGGGRMGEALLAGLLAAEWAAAGELAVVEKAESRRRHLEKEHKAGSVRFLLLVLTLITTAVVVTIAMFQTLYFVMG